MKHFTFEEITKSIDAAWNKQPFDRIIFGSTPRGVTILYSGEGYDGLHGGFAACSTPQMMEVRLREYAEGKFPQARPSKVSELV